MKIQETEALTLTYRVYVRQMYDVTPLFVEMADTLAKRFPPVDFIVQSSDLSEYSTPILPGEYKSGATVMTRVSGDIRQDYHIIREQVFTVIPRSGTMGWDEAIDQHKWFDEFAVIKITITGGGDFEAL